MDRPRASPFSGSLTSTFQADDGPGALVRGGGHGRADRQEPQLPSQGCPAFSRPARAFWYPYALTPNIVELIPTLGALFPREGPVQDPVLIAGSPHS